MIYDISKTSVPQMPTLEKGEKASFSVFQNGKKPA